METLHKKKSSDYSRISSSSIVLITFSGLYFFLIRNYESYKQLLRLLGRVVSSVSRPIPAQDNTNRLNAEIRGLSGIRTHDPSV
jgi:hypothetical protein